MARVGRVEYQDWGWVRWRVAALGIVLVLGLGALKSGAGEPEWLHASHVTVAVLLVAGGLILGRYLLATPDDKRDLRVVTLQLELLIVLLAVAYMSRTPGFVFGINRTFATWLIVGILLLFCVLAGDPRAYTPVQWLVIGCLALVVGIFFHHSLSIAEASTRSRHPVWSGFIMAVGMVVLPQYLTREQFVWALSRLTVAIVLLTLPLYIYGEYAVYGLRFTFSGGYTVPLIGYEVAATRGFFVNRNIFATIVFAGLIAAVADFHRAYSSDRATPFVVVPALVVALNAVGLLIAYGRALFVLTPMALGIYAAYVVYGRRAIPVAVAGGLLYLAVGILGVHSGLIPLPEGASTRARRWYPAIAAIRNHPSLLGEGLINPGAFISEYHPWGWSGSPHNSYLSIWIRTGIVGGLAYLALVVAGLVEGVRRYRTIHVGVLVLAVGTATHQLFEAYTMFGWWSSSVLGTLIVGFLVFGSNEVTRSEQTLDVSDDSDQTLDVPDGSDRTSEPPDVT